MLKEVYEKIQERHKYLDFSALWPNFHVFPFTLYDGEQAYMAGEYFPQPEEFRGNTTVYYQGEQIAIWNLPTAQPEPDIDLLAANLVHEMFHAWQMTQGEQRFPNDLAALDYPMEENNLCAKLYENRILAQAFRAGDVHEKRRLLACAAGVRRSRESILGKAIDHELLPETVEGMAEFIAMQVLSTLSPEKYDQNAAWYLNEITTISPMLLDIRRQSYFTGAIMLLTAKDAGLDFYHDPGTETRPIFHILVESLPQLDGGSWLPVPEIDELVSQQREQRESTVRRLLEKGHRTDGDFSICGYDPMNMWKHGQWLYGRHFWMLRDRSDGKNHLLSGESLLLCGEGNRIQAYVTDV